MRKFEKITVVGSAETTAYVAAVRNLALNAVKVAESDVRVEVCPNLSVEMLRPHVPADDELMVHVADPRVGILSSGPSMMNAAVISGQLLTVSLLTLLGGRAYTPPDFPESKGPLLVHTLLQLERAFDEPAWWCHALCDDADSAPVGFVFDYARGSCTSLFSMHVDGTVERAYIVRSHRQVKDPARFGNPPFETRAREVLTPTEARDLGWVVDDVNLN